MFNLFVFILVIFGALNWFCIGLFQFDVVAGIFGAQAAFASRFIYSLIGLAGVCLLTLAGVKKGTISLKKNSCNSCPFAGALPLPTASGKSGKPTNNDENATEAKTPVASDSKNKPKGKRYKDKVDSAKAETDSPDTDNKVNVVSQKD